jgi:hypothetical protein
MSDTLKPTPPVKRDYAMFEADISGAVLNMQLLRRLLRWLAPYKVQLLLSTGFGTARLGAANFTADNYFFSCYRSYLAQ